MAGRFGGQQSSDPQLLSAAQQNLLAAALNSQAPVKREPLDTDPNSFLSGHSIQPSPAMNGPNGALFMSPQQAELDGFGAEYTPDLDYLDGDSFDFDNADLGGDLIGALPGSGSDGFGVEHHEKRKNSDDSEEGDAKRQETKEGEKSAKKPGRKPLTSEPTTKRKAQNRAAQRAFRERKEAHLKDLETKVNELTKADEAYKHENGVLKAQVERLQVELRAYRKRLSLNGTSGRVSPPTASHSNSNRSDSNASAQANNFSFDFPKFGALPGSQIFGNGNLSESPTGDVLGQHSLTPSSSGSPVATSLPGAEAIGQRQRVGSNGRSLSPQSVKNAVSNMTPNSNTPPVSNQTSAFTTYSSVNNMHGFANTLPQMRAEGSDPFGDLFSPSLLKSASIGSAGQYFASAAASDKNTASRQANTNADSTYGTDNSSGFSRVFQFNSAQSNSDSTSPSAASSNWNVNANSSTGTSPEPSHGSPAVKDRSADSFSSTNQIASGVQAPQTQPQDPNSSLFAFPEFNVPTSESFDPVLFGDYRDSNEAIVGGGDFTGGFFDDALNPAPYDLGSPSNLFGILQSPPTVNAALDVNAPPSSQNLMAKMDKVCDGKDDDYSILTAKPVEKTAEAGKLISCNNIWNQLQANTDFQDGKFDLEGLCSELRSKARCSESGVLVDKDHVDAALRKLGKKDDNGKPFTGPGLMFEQASWDKVLKKMNH